ncbi:hypothetical protein M9H77_25975 [Catharanthus roseus]|uniref:Uncharacterized protein n=1 Tax=Catharanthus roseus TaxID=4058 RepID=A0ACC0AB32_CATRO|nr:hypothetical protein M9H77_25975 [Catharanthus roseus]
MVVTFGSRQWRIDVDADVERHKRATSSGIGPVVVPVDTRQRKYRRVEWSFLRIGSPDALPAQNDVDPNTFEEFLEPEEYVDHGHLFATDQIFNLKVELVNWAKETAIKVNTYLIVTRYLSSRTSDRRPYVTLGFERGGENKSRTKLGVDDKEEEVQVKRQGPYKTKKCGCPFKLKGEQMTTCENWQLFVYDGRHNHAIGVYTHGHAQTAKLTEEQLIQTEQFRKSHVPPVISYYFFGNKTVQKIYNVVVNIKKNRMQGRNTIEEVLCLSTQRGYMVFYRNCGDNNVLMRLLLLTQHQLK